MQSKSDNSLLRKIELAWLVALVLATLVFCVVTRQDLLSGSVLLSGIVCVVLTALGRREGYLAGLYSSVAYAWIAYQNGLFGEVWLNLGFYLPTGVIGFVMWQRRSVGQVVMMRALSWRHRGLIAGGCVIGTVALGLVLGRIPAQNTPMIDASTNVIAIVATLLMMWRYQEQWLFTCCSTC